VDPNDPGTVCHRAYSFTARSNWSVRAGFILQNSKSNRPVITGCQGGAAGPVQLLFGTTYLPLGPRCAPFAAKAQ
jgi:hypothetical protein